MTAIDFHTYEKLFMVTPQPLPHSLFAIRLREMVEGDGASRFVTAYGPRIKALGTDVAATYFASWYGRVCSAFQYALWHDAVILDLTLDNLTLQMTEEDTYTVLAFCMKNAHARALPQCERRDVLIKSMEFFYGQARQLLEAIAAAGRISPGQLWGQLATRLHYLQDYWSKEAKTEQQQELLHTTFDMLCKQLRPEVFGRSKNPFDVKFRMVEDPYEPGAMMRVKATCCLAYRTDTGHGYCYTCPRLSKADRELMRQKMIADSTT